MPSIIQKYPNLGITLNIIFIIFTAYWIYVSTQAAKTSHFASERAKQLTAQAKAAFAQAPPSAPSNYQAFKAHVPGADPVLYSDFRALWERGQLTPEMVERTLS